MSTVASVTDRIAIVGDVGGFVEQLRGCLFELGVRDGVWPAGLHVIQVGDLLGGNDDLACAQLVEPHLYAGRWTQLIGNWELSAVGGPRVSRGGISASRDALAVFSRWFGDGLAHYATTVASPGGVATLVTHAGLTSQWWIDHLGRDHDVESVARRINTAPPSALHYAGEMVGYGQVGASPVWASTRELWTSWWEEPMPWAQVHGHTTAYGEQGFAHRPVPVELTRRRCIEASHHHTIFRPPGSAPDCAIYGIDPGLVRGSPSGALHARIVACNTRSLAVTSR